MITLTPNNVTSFPGARLIFKAFEDGVEIPLSTSLEATVEIYFPGEHPYRATIHESDNTFSWIVPLSEGNHEVRALITWADTSEYAEFNIQINSTLAAKFTYVTEPNIVSEGTVYADIYSPLGQLVHSAPMTDTGYGYQITITPGGDWFGEYLIRARDDNGLLEENSFWIEKTSLASMNTFFSLAPWQRQVIEYLKYEMMGDTEPLHPGALFTLEEYAKHWNMTVGEVNAIMPSTSFLPPEIPLFWGNVMMKGTLLRVYHALANRGVTVPRWQNLNSPIQDESHYQDAYEKRYSLLRPEYEEERAYMKAAHLPRPAITVDPFLGWMGGNLAGQTGLARLQHPSWFTGVWGGIAR